MEHILTAWLSMDWRGFTNPNDWIKGIHADFCWIKGIQILIIVEMEFLHLYKLFLYICTHGCISFCTFVCWTMMQRANFAQPCPWGSSFSVAWELMLNLIAMEDYSRSIIRFKSVLILSYAIIPICSILPMLCHHIFLTPFVCCKICDFIEDVKLSETHCKIGWRNCEARACMVDIVFQGFYMENWPQQIKNLICSSFKMVEIHGHFVSFGCSCLFFT